MWVNSLFFKIFAGFWLFILLVIAALTVLPKLDSRQLRPLDRPSLIMLEKITQRLILQVARHPTVPLSDLLTRVKGPGGHKVYLVEEDGSILNGRAPKALRRFIVDSDNPAVPKVSVQPNWYMIGPIVFQYNDQNYLLYSSRYIRGGEKYMVAWLLDNPGLLILVAILVSTPLCLLLAWHLTSPLRKLQQASSKIAKGDFDAELPQINRGDEIGRMASSMHQMVFTLKETLSNQQRLLSDISHELRSPLTRLRLALAISRKHQGESKELQRIDIEAERLEQMIADLLGLSRMQLNQQEKQHIRLDSLFEELLEDAEFEAEQKGKVFAHQGDLVIELNAYPALLSSAVENIIRNAIKYAGSNVIMDITKTGDEVNISVSDDGPGVPESELEQIFRPFYRVSEARDRESGGTGLGLAIAENAVRKHGGSIVAENLSPGLKINLAFPLRY